MSGQMVEIRWHGRGGQGVVLASRFLASSAIRENLYFQAFPFFGPERLGAPIVAFTRVSREPIDLHCAIEEPDVVVVLDPSLLGVVNVTANLKNDGIAVVNHTGVPQELKNDTNCRVYVVDADKISREELGRVMPNTPMVGALVRAVGLVSLESVLAEFEDQFSLRFKPEVIQQNLNAIRRAYEEVREI